MNKISLISLIFITMFFASCSWEIKWEQKTNTKENITEKDVSSLSKNEQPQETEIKTLDYKIVKTENLWQKLYKKMRYKIVIFWEANKAQLMATSEKIIKELMKEDDAIDELILFLYSDEKTINDWYDIGTAIWAPMWELGNTTNEIIKNKDRSNYKISYNIKENIEEYLKQRLKSENKLGFTEEERKDLFKVIVAAEDKANYDAEQLFPTDFSNPMFKESNLMDEFHKSEELSIQYKKEVRKKHGLSEQQEKEIKSEWLKEWWPFE